MLSKNKSKYIQQLFTKKQRLLNQEFVIEGKKLFEEAVLNNWEIKESFATESFISENRELISQLNIEIATPEELTKAGQLSSNNSVLAIVKTKQNQLTDVHWETGISLILSDIKDPGNLGTILRTAAWFGIKNVICSLETVDLYNPKVVQSSMGAIFNCSVFYTELNSLLEKATKKQLPIYAADLQGDNPTIINGLKNGLLVLGSESHGVPMDLKKFITNKICIPQANNSSTESLNVAIANAILCYEINR